MAGTIVVDRIESDASYASSINVAGQITFSNTVNFGVFAGTAPVAGFYLPATNTLAFTTASTERMRIDSSGNVGIGTTTPGSTPFGQLVVAGANNPFATNDNANLVVRSTDAAAVNKGGMIGFAGSSDSGNYTFATIKGAKEGTDSGYLAFATRTAAAFATERMRIDSSGNVGIGTSSPSQKLEVATASGGTIGLRYIGNSGYATVGTDGSNNLLFSIGNPPSEKMRIDSSGNLLVGHTNVDAKFTLRGAGNSLPIISAFGTSAGDLAIPSVQIIKTDNNTTTSQVFFKFYVAGGGAGCGQINSNGAATAAFGSFSDSRLKENIADLPSQLANIMALRPVEFDYIASEGGGHQIGFIAQEVKEIYPDLVGEREDGMYTLTDMNKNDARLIKAIQEQQALITALTERITAIESK